MAQEDGGPAEGVVLIEPRGETSGANSSEPAPHGTNVGLLILFVVLLAGIMASNIWLRKRAERGKS